MKNLWMLVLAAMMICSAACPGGAKAEEGGEMTLLAVNVRKGDALLLRSGESCYLIDTGKKKNYDALYRVLKENGITRLTGVILTHSHSDHTGGLKQLVKSDIRIEHVYTSAFFVPEEEDKENPVIKALKKTDLKPEYLKGGDSLPLDGGKLEVLGPLEKSETENCNSLVLLATGGGGSILLTGDMEFPEERSLLNAGRIPHADVLKIANHGEGDATSDQLVAAVSPSLALISTNTEDEPDTPDPRVMRLLGTYGIPVAKTQETESGVLVTLRNGEIITEMK